MTGVPHRFYRQVTYDDQPQAYVFINTNTLVPAKNSMYIIFHEPHKRNFRYKPWISQFRQIKAEDCDWRTRYLLCQDVIFNQMTDQTMLGKVEMNRYWANKSMTYGSKPQTMNK